MPSRCDCRQQRVGPQCSHSGQKQERQKHKVKPEELLMNPDSTLNLTSAPWRPVWLIRMIPVEVAQQILVQNAMAGHPRPLLRPVLLPVNKVLPVVVGADRRPRYSQPRILDHHQSSWWKEEVWMAMPIPKPGLASPERHGR